MGGYGIDEVEGAEGCEAVSRSSSTEREARARLIRAAVLLALALLALVPRWVRAQDPWTTRLATTMNPLPIGACGPVQITVRDSASRDVPRNPSGNRVTIADFDLSVTTGDPRALSSYFADQYHWYVCACQAATVGAAVTMTATYPARALATASRVPGVSYTVSAPLTVAKADGASEPRGCPAVVNTVAAGGPTSIGGTPVVGGPVGTVPTGKTIASTGLAPQGVAVTGTPTRATVTWQKTLGASSYTVERWNDANPTCCRVTATGITGTTWSDSVFSAPGMYSYTVTALDGNGGQGATTATYLPPQPKNPITLIALHSGYMEDDVELTWPRGTGADYFMLWGPTLPTTGVRVDSLKYSLKSVPVGLHRWTIASVYEPGAVTTPVTSYTTGTIQVNDVCKLAPRPIAPIGPAPLDTLTGPML